jgi:uncharacterized protein (DUF1501 family)
MNTIGRRGFLQLTGSAAIATLLPRLSPAEGHEDSRFVLVILRGALDGLAAVPPYAEPSYARLRGELAIAARDLKLDGTFALHPSLELLHERFRERELVVFHAAATPYRERSHFDGQDVLEQGTASSRDGWLNRALPFTARARDKESEAIALALAQNVPLVLRGEARVSSWAPSRLPQADSDTLQRIQDLYAGDEYFASRLNAALAAEEVAGGMGNAGGGRRDPARALGAVTSAAGKFLAADNGPRIAVIEAGGWDTHANQGGDRGQLANRLAALDAGIESMRTALGPAWSRTAMLVVTEFGRTVAVNGSRGTDHGTATCALLCGGAVEGGRVAVDWPGLSPGALHENRDLRPTLDLRSVFKGVLAAHLGVPESALEEKVFPDSRAAKPVEGLIKPA